MEISIDLKKIGTLLNDHPKSIAIFEEEVGKIFEEGTSFLMREVVRGTPVYRGHLAGSVFREVKGSGLGLHGLVATPLAYASFIETGEPPHVPNFGNLAEWVRAKMGLTGSNLYAVVTVISRKMATSGVKPHFMFKRAFETGKIEIQKIINRAEKRIIERLSR